jgi:hypothetical protein
MSPNPSSRSRTPYKPPRDTREVVKAAVAVVGVLVVTALAIFLLQPDDSSSTQTPVVNTSGSGSTATTPASSTPASTTPASTPETTTASTP